MTKQTGRWIARVSAVLPELNKIRVSKTGRVYKYEGEKQDGKRKQNTKNHSA
jgi:arginine repressor